MIFGWKNYVILLKVGERWEEFTAQYARSANAALAQVGIPGTYKVVPARSWRTRTWPKA